MIGNTADIVVKPLAFRLRIRISARGIYHGIIGGYQLIYIVCNRVCIRLKANVGRLAGFA